jgi:hypothetical protein
MKSILAMAVAVTALGFLSIRAYADTYSVTGVLWGEGTEGFQGIDSSGNVYIYNFDTGVYLTLFNGRIVNTSSVEPNFINDRGEICATPVPGVTVTNPSDEICNNGRIAYLVGGITASLYVYSGTGTPQLIGPAFAGDLIAMNSIGDIVFDDGFADLAYEAIDLTSEQTPEPASILLVGTGIAAICVTLVRRRTPHLTF